MGRTNSVLPPHVPASHLMIPRRIHSLLDVPSKPLSLASTARDSPGVHLDEHRLRSSVMMVRRVMSACGDFFKQEELGSGVCALEPLPVRCASPSPNSSLHCDRHSSRTRAPPHLGIMNAHGMGRPKVQKHLLMRQIAVAPSEAPGKVDIGVCREKPGHTTATPRAPRGT